MTQKLPQICTVILCIYIGKIAWFAVCICGNFSVAQYLLLQSAIFAAFKPLIVRCTFHECTICPHITVSSLISVLALTSWVEGDWISLSIRLSSVSILSIFSISLSLDLLLSKSSIWSGKDSTPSRSTLLLSVEFSPSKSSSIYCSLLTLKTWFLRLFMLMVEVPYPIPCAVAWDS